MRDNRIFLVGEGYTNDFFDIDVSDDDMSLKPYFDKGYHSAEFALKLADDGFSGIGLNLGDYLLFSNYSMEPIWNKPVLVRMEGRFIIRLAADVNPVESTFTTASDVYPPLILPSENIRIAAVVSGFIKPHDGLVLNKGYEE